MATNLLSAAQRTEYQSVLDDVFATFARPLQMYVEAKTVSISTTALNSRFGQHDQNVFNPAVTPQVYTVSGCIYYGAKQEWPYSNPNGDGNANSNQLKLRDAEGTVRIKVDASGYGLMKNAKRVNLDGFDFTMTSTPRPHGLVGAPTRWTFTMTRVD